MRQSGFFHVSLVSGSHFGVSPKEYRGVRFDREMISGQCFCLQAREGRQ